MSKFDGKKISVEIFGESHSQFIGGNAKGFPETKVDFDKLSEFLGRRKAVNSVFSTARIEEDKPIFDSIENSTLPSDFSFKIENKNVKSRDYSPLHAKPRPSHADYAWFLKDGELDFTGGGRFSGRLTAPFCVVGGIAKQILESKGIFVEAYVSKIGKVKGLSYNDKPLSRDEIVKKRAGEFCSLNKKEKMLEEIKKAKEDKDSVGGKIECIVFGMQKGVGDNLFGGLEGKISSLIYAVPAVKGVEFGKGFNLCEMKGSDANDNLYYEDGSVKFYSNNAGGINGGISNGEPITIGVAIRPTPSIAKKQKTVDLINKKSTEIEIIGRHDACIVPRAVPVIEAAVSIAILDEII